MQTKNQVIYIVLALILFGCNVDINPSRCEINVKQGNVNIPCETGYFDFGNIPLGFSQTITFTIENTGIHVLRLIESTPVLISGVNKSDFKISATVTTRDIAPNSYTTFSIKFQPTALEQRTACVTILNNDKDENPYTFVIVGNCTEPAPEIHIKQGDNDIMNNSGSYDFGMISVNESSDQIPFRIENNGNKTLTIILAPGKVNISGSDSSMFLVNDRNTQISIQGGNYTTFSITFQPTSPGVKTAKVSIMNNDSDESPYIFNLRGIGVATPEINVKQDTTNILNGIGKYDFESILINESSPEIQFIIENIGTSVLLLTRTNNLIQVDGADSTMFIVNESSIKKTLQPGELTAFTLRFAPTSSGVKTASVSIANNDGDENPYVFTVSGIGIEPEIDINQGYLNIPNITGSFDFGTLFIGNSSTNIIFTISNTGYGDLKLTGTPMISITGADASMFRVNQISTISTIAYGSSTSFLLAFTPTSFGSKTATVSIANNDTDENPYTFTLKGAGRYPYPEINVKQGSTDIVCTTGSYDFGSIEVDGYSLDVIFTIENLGSSNIELTGDPIISLAGSDAAMFTLDHTLTSKTINVGFSTTFTICFSPTSSGSKNAVISIVNNDPDENPYTFSITGTGKNYDPGDCIGWIGGGSNGWKTGTAPMDGETYQHFDDPKYACVDSSGNIYVADASNARVSKWNLKGAAIGWIGGSYNGWKTHSINREDKDYQSFYHPSGVFIDSSGYIYVADQYNHRICKWDSSGNAIGWIGGGSNGWKTNKTYGADDDDYQSFCYPSSVYVDSVGYIYVADRRNNRICKWDSNGNAIGWIGGGSNGWKTTTGASSSYYYNSFFYPEGVYVDSSGNIYVCDTENDRLSKWDNSGNAIGWIGGGSNGWKTGPAPVSGRDYQSFRDLNRCFVSNSGYIYIADTGNHRISKWDISGNAVGWIGGGSKGWKTSISSTSNNGTDYLSFYNPLSVFVDTDGHIFVADTFNQRVCKWKD